MSTDKASPQLIQQRLRNRLIEWLELVVASEKAAPAYGLDELLNDWEPWNSELNSTTNFPPPTYNEAEVSTLLDVDKAWGQFCDVTPNSIRDEFEVMQLPEWVGFISATRYALSVFRIRGKLSEEREQTSISPTKHST